MADSKLPESSTEFSNEIPSETQNFFITFDDMKCKAATISTSEDDPSSGRYKFVFHAKKPQVEMVSTADTTTAIAQVSYHTFSTKMDVVMYPRGSNKQEFIMQAKKALAGKPEYDLPSPTLGGVNITWQTVGALKAYFDFILLDDNAIPLARFHAAGIRGNWSSKKIGKLEITSRCAEKAGLLDEVAATLMALIYHHFMQVNPAGALAMTSSALDKVQLNPS